MRRVEAEALVGASRDEVWRLYDDIAGMPRWVPFVREIVYVSGPLRVGTVYRERGRFTWLPGAEQWEIVEYRRPSDQVRATRTRGLEVTLALRFEARGTGTWVHHAAELRSDLWGPLGWLHEVVTAIPVAWSVRAAAAGAKRSFEGDRPR
jgi:uncharacterized protein YndB with AHSA1/START domain